jgi:hypothetical protein
MPRKLPVSVARALGNQGLAQTQQPRGNKSGARSVVVDGIRFDSRGEAVRYQQLVALEAAGEIRALSLQPRFEIQPGFTRPDGEKVRPIHYVADFQYQEVQTGRVVVEDFKGFETEAFKLKRKMFFYRFPDLELRMPRKRKN